jgi:hypothetical protein
MARGYFPPFPYLLRKEIDEEKADKVKSTG